MLTKIWQGETVQGAHDSAKASTDVARDLRGGLRHERMYGHKPAPSGVLRVNLREPLENDWNRILVPIARTNVPSADAVKT